MKQSRGRPKAFDEDEVLVLAMNYFWEHGYDNTSLDNLLIAMGIKKSSFYHTFKSKEELFSKTLDLYRCQMLTQLKTMQNEIGGKEALLMLSTLTIKELEETGKVRGCLLVNSGQECYQKYENLSKQVSIEFNFFQEVFVDLVKLAQDDGEISSNKEAHIIAGRYMNMLNGLVVTIQAGASKELIEDIVENLKEILK